VPELDPVAGLGVGDGDDEGGRREERAAKCSPAAVVYQLEQEEVDQQQGEQAGVLSRNRTTSVPDLRVADVGCR